jgi:hypothetical protein
VTRRSAYSTFEYLIGIAGLFSMLVIAHLTQGAPDPGGTLASRLRGMGARRIIDLIALAGWALDVITGRRRSRLACPRPADRVAA